MAQLGADVWQLELIPNLRAKRFGVRCRRHRFESGVADAAVQSCQTPAPSRDHVICEWFFACASHGKVEDLDLGWAPRSAGA